jgi:DNA-binding IclR family transcriptional regulator
MIVTSISRAFALIELLDRNELGMGIREMARQLDLHPANIQRIIATLMDLGYVEKEGRSSLYRLSFKAFFLGQSLTKHDRIVAAASAELEALGNTLGLNAYLAMRRSDKAVYIHAAQLCRIRDIRVAPGESMHLHTTAMGKALMMDMTDSQLKMIYPVDELPIMTPFSISRRAQLEMELRESYDRGYTSVREENAFGLASIGAPIRDETGGITASLSVAFLWAAIDAMQQEEIATAVIRAADRLSRLAGCPNKYLIANTSV